MYNLDMTSVVSKTSYLNMGTKRIARDSGAGITYYFADHLGSTRIVMDVAGNCTYNEEIYYLVTAIVNPTGNATVQVLEINESDYKELKKDTKGAGERVFEI